ncbi:MAG: ComEC/Rec2 family competence protein [Patescibacteria group bacterium]|jgi:beta-lactamase superfamily II metal-dependent hydrolase
MSANSFSRLKAPFLFLAVCLVAVGIWTFQAKEPNTLRVWFADVGQGDGIILRTPDQSTIIVDGGPSRSFLKDVDRHVPMNDKDIDLLVSTNPDADHLVGLVPLLESGRVRNVLLNRIEKNTTVYKKFLEVIDAQHIHSIEAAVGQVYTFGDVSLTVLWPDPGLLPGLIGKRVDYNTGSIILHVQHGDNDFLLTGDATIRAEDALLASHGVPDVEILKVGHHGSRTSTGKKLLDVIKPEYGIISVGQKNRYGHPTAEALARLTAAGAKIFRTDQQGTILVESSQNQLRVIPERAVP